MDKPDTQEMEALYGAAVGPEKADYYVPRFLNFDQPGACKISWNWPAFFVTFWWGIYRRMFRDSLLFCLAVPFAYLFLLGVVSVAIPKGKFGLALVLLLPLYSLVLVPMYANALYHRNVRRRIRSVRRRTTDIAAQIAVLENLPHTSGWVFFLCLSLAIPVFGILAAIAIPAYQDYMIRSQITEGLSLSQPLEAAVARSFQQKHMWPADTSALDPLPPVTGHFVSDISVNGGTLSIRFGNKANALIADKVLSLRPVLDGDRIRWDCGYRNVGEGAGGTPPAAEGVTTVPPKYLPKMCRE